MRKSKTGDEGLLSAGGHAGPPRLMRGKTIDDFKEYKQTMQHQKAFVSVTPAPKDATLSADDITRKLDVLTREINVTQKLICSKFDKLNEFLLSNHFDSKPNEPKPPPPVTPAPPELDRRFDRVRESINKGRVSIFTGRRPSGLGISVLAARESNPAKGLESVAQSPDLPAAHSRSPQESPPASPRSTDGPKSFPEESDSSKGDEVSDSEPFSRQDSKGSSPKSKQFEARRSQTVGTLGTDTWRTWTSDNVRRSTLMSSKLSALSGRISGKWVSLVSSYTFTEAESSLGKSDSIKEVLSQRTTKQSTMAFKAWNFLDNSESSWSAKLYDTLEPYFLMFAVILSLLQTLPDPPSFWPPSLACKAIDLVIDGFIMLDVLIRYVVSPSRGLTFFKKWLNIVDILAAWPFVARIYFIIVANGWSDDPLMFCFVAIARLLKMMRRFQKIHLLLGAFELALEAMPVLAYVLALVALTFSTAVYVVEPRDNFDTLPRAIYFTLVTVTSLGYGDYTPDTAAGQIIASTLTICSAAYMAMPLGIIGSAFTSVWQDRDRILLTKKTRQAMHTWGFTAEDIPMLFTFFDSKGVGALSLQDFREMIVAMRIGLSDTRVRELFKTFDKNGSGRVDDKEFVRQIFPQEYLDVFALSDVASSSSNQHSSGTLRVPEATGKSSTKAASASEADRRASSPQSSLSGSPRSSLPTRSLSVPTRSPSGRSHPLTAPFAPFAINALPRQPQADVIEPVGSGSPITVFHSEPSPAERHLD